jgi:hypothetical protein
MLTIEGLALILYTSIPIKSLPFFWRSIVPIRAFSQISDQIIPYRVLRYGKENRTLG